MAKIVWTEIAIDDLNNIANYHSQYSNNFASSLIKKLFNKPKILKGMPELGRVVPERDNEFIRELIEGNYRIIYYYDSEIDTVEIITVHHASQPFL
ncbi:type II toxin-antitoxin system RelE/ParE family toxin [Pedobacter paludis]|uniref:Type II toxin-antitoxin system mRNA interferase toxin, RelE/StbE family n=1 Tax=Pedobacter paludis TaxID=2203212 RepID=A0A317EVF2_9SPHI|nr:type II toxin-antitoxin system RelE/ParE family toxin [Pedobacter paludis]PWS29847.1 type II toxin-antitoxin system mRNA interferase toxin, RelE/StbE family [Pedobacter paludis]